MTQTKEIVIVGAGVIGLSCAYLLVLEGYKVTILSSLLPSTSTKNPLYTSAWAGAHFRPFPSKSKAELRDYPLTRSSYKKFVELAAKYPESSIKFVEGYDYIEKHDPLYENISTGYAEELTDFKRLPENELPNNVKFGAKYKTYVLNAPVYVQFLERKLRMESNVTIIQNEVQVYNIMVVTMLIPIRLEDKLYLSDLQRVTLTSTKLSLIKWQMGTGAL
ncbi:unnamed protein product [[Candida] boidinii]|nr:unnamed protein product [[Candida] boidinii]GMF97458.1 unnamed protein product [[Candida] boidinii]